MNAKEVDALVLESAKLIEEHVLWTVPKVQDVIAACVKAEGQRILERVEETIKSWRKHPEDPNSSMVIAAFEVFKSCLTHRGVTYGMAMTEHFKRLGMPVPEAIQKRIEEERTRGG